MTPFINLQRLEIAAALTGVLTLTYCTSGNDLQEVQQASSNDDYSQCPTSQITPAPALGINDRVQTAEDDNAIRELKFQYSDAFGAVVADPNTVNNILDLFIDTPCVDYGALGIFHDKQGLQYFFQEVLPSLSAWSFHVASQPIININNDVASGTWDAIINSVAKSNYAAGPQPTFVMYSDRYQRTTTGWSFSAVTVNFDIPPTSP